MILRFSDYRYFLEADRKSLGIEGWSYTLLFNQVYRFQVRLRRLEYLQNCQFPLPLIWLYKFLYWRLSSKIGFSISPNTFGPGLSIAHRGTLIVNGGARVGANCRIHPGVTIGTNAGKHAEAPQIGDNCYLGPGAKIFGNIVIGDGTVVGANAVVNRSFPQGNQTIAGVPAKVVSSKSSVGFLIQGSELAGRSYRSDNRNVRL
jgi:serine O-acetyltransferase